MSGIIRKGRMGWTKTTLADDVSMVANHGYVIAGSGTTNLTLPLIANVGDVIEIIGLNQKYNILQNDGQFIRHGLTSVTTTGVGSGYQTSDMHTSILLKCVTANTEFMVIESQGTFSSFDAPVPQTFAHFKMNDNAASTTVVDAAGSINGTSSRNTNLVSVAGRINTALSFNGSSDVVTTPTFSVDFSQSWSFAFWHFQPTDTAGNLGTILQFGNPDGSSIIFYHNIDGGTAGACQAPASEGDLCMAWLPSLPAIACTPVQNAWSHIVGVFDTSLSELRLYLNGDLISTVSFSPGSVEASSSLFIGAQAGNANWGKGSIDDLRVLQSAADQTTVDNLFNGGAGIETEI